MADGQEKKISLNFKGLSKPDLEAIAKETLGAAHLPYAVMDLDADGQIRLLRDMTRDLREDWKGVLTRPDYARLIHAKDIDEQYDALTALTEETKEALGAASKKRAAIKDMKFHLYLQSPHPEVRLRMMRYVDKVIQKEFSARNTGKVTDAYWHDLLYLSTFGGKMTRDRQDVYHLAYEFNAEAKKGGGKAAVPWNPMEMLFEAHMTKVYAEETSGNNLTPLGKAVLVRMNERNGTPQAQGKFRKLPQPGASCP